MHPFSPTLLLVTLLAQFSLTLGTLVNGTTILPPTQDPFYKPPPGFEREKPGTILRHRSTPKPIYFPGNDTSVKASYQILYRTTNGHGEPEAGVTTLIVPLNPDPAKLLSYQIAYDTADPDCSPSYLLQDPSYLLSPGNLIIGDDLLVHASLNQGWYLSTPDFEGPNAAFNAGVQAGQSTLDSIRAVLASGNFSGIDCDAATAMWGYSGGSLASEWAAEVQPNYASELKFVGVALGGLVPNITAIIESLNGTKFASLSPSALLGIANGFPQYKDYLNAHLLPSKAAQFKAVEHNCSSQNVSTDTFSYFKSGIGILVDQIPSLILNGGTQMGLRAVPQMPIFLYKAVGDEYSPIGNTDEIYNNYCSRNASIQYQRNSWGEHLTEAITGAPAALQFLIDRFAGKPFDSACNVTNVTITSLDPAIEAVVGATVYQQLDLSLQSAANSATEAGIPLSH